MRIALPALILLTACTGEANHLGNPLLLPLGGLATATENAVYGARRGEVEVFVKTNHPALIADLRAGGGPTLTRAFDIARVPADVRPVHTLKMQGDLPLYQTNLEALVVAIMVVSG